MFFIFLISSAKAASSIFPVKFAEIGPRENITEYTLVMVAVDFSREAFAGTVRTLAELQMARETARWIKSIETSAGRAA